MRCPSNPLYTSGESFDDAFMAYRKLVQRDLELEETQLPSWRDAAPQSETGI